jgi:hypothetical protein
MPRKELYIVENFLLYCEIPLIDSQFGRSIPSKHQQVGRLVKADSSLQLEYLIYNWRRHSLNFDDFNLDAKISF